MFKIFKTTLNDDIQRELILLSQNWEKENSCYGYVANSASSFKDKDVFIVKKEERIIGYLICHVYTQKEDTATVKKTSRCLEIDEIYVLPEYRSQGLGKQLFNVAIDCYNSFLDFVTLSTASKNYKAILHFYIEELDMTFWCASLFKKIN